MNIILFLFFMTILLVAVKCIVEFGFNRNTLLMILSKIWWLRGFFFIVAYLYTCINMVYKVSDGSGYSLIPFIFCGIAGMLSMYGKTRKYGLYLFVISFCFGLFVVFPFIGIINSYISGDANTEDIIGSIIFIMVGLFMGIYSLNVIKKDK